jgi:putative restriction endonuclease
MGYVEQNSETYALTAAGHEFVDEAVASWADSERTPERDDEELTAGTYETTVHARQVDPEFRATVLSRHDHTCPVSCVDHPGLLDVAHVSSWSEYPEHRADVANVLPLSKTHHAAFDRKVFTIDREYRIQVNPDFDTESELLERTLVERDGEHVSLPDGSVSPEYLAQHNAAIGWV